MSEDREREDPGFTVRDRRAFTQSDSAAPKEPPPAAGPAAGSVTGSAAQAESAKQPPRQPLPDIDFSTFVISLSTSALYHLGAIPDPESGAAEVNLPLAKQTIDILGMLRDKTEGNRTPEETRLLDGLLYDLRLRYVDGLRK